MIRAPVPLPFSHAINKVEVRCSSHSIPTHLRTHVMAIAKVCFPFDHGVDAQTSRIKRSEDRDDDDVSPPIAKGTICIF